MPDPSFQGAVPLCLRRKTKPASFHLLRINPWGLLTRARLTSPGYLCGCGFANATVRAGHQKGSSSHIHLHIGWIEVLGSRLIAAPESIRDTCEKLEESTSKKKQKPNPGEG